MRLIVSIVLAGVLAFATLPGFGIAGPGLQPADCTICPEGSAHSQIAHSQMTPSQMTHSQTAHAQLAGQMAIPEHPTMPICPHMAACSIVMIAQAPVALHRNDASPSRPASPIAILWFGRGVLIDLPPPRWMS